MAESGEGENGMNCGMIIKELEKKYPCRVAESWDNPGLQVGRRDKEVKKIFVALDATGQVVAQAIEEEADMILTHHPLLMSPLRKVNTDDFIGRRVVTLIREDISCYAMHTNHDIVTMGALAAEALQMKELEVLEPTCEIDGKEEGFGRFGKLPKSMTLRACGEFVKQTFGLETVKIFGDLEQEVEKAALLPGSGKSLVGAALHKGADVMISGDFGHHDGIDAVMQGLPVIDAGHYGIEHIFIAQMADFLQKNFPEIQVTCEKITNPFQVI